MDTKETREHVKECKQEYEALAYAKSHSEYEKAYLLWCHTWDKWLIEQAEQNKARERSINDLIFGSKKQAKKLSDAQARIKELEEVIKAVAHIGIDFGHGNYTLEQKYIDNARKLMDE